MTRRKLLLGAITAANIPSFAQLPIAKEVSALKLARILNGEPMMYPATRVESVSISI